ncbi:hypothetical protein [Streptomyces sp. TLI_171]|uniref:hypothetical protein n=1 Tax=Streptomyces sp. TLI_171 TaxID=1938859 RepID=UPI00217CF2EA|nr:hypothetical protein [Streptomyces sp. TLI_171]
MERKLDAGRNEGKQNMYEYEIFKGRERELHGRAAAERLAREAVAAHGSVGLLGRVARAVRREASPRVAKSGTAGARSGAAAGCA